MSNIITQKDELSNALENILRNFVLGISFVQMSEYIPWSKLSDTTLKISGNSGHAEIALGNLFSNVTSLQKDRPILVEEFLSMLRRAAASEGHELILQYCEASKQFETYKAKSWFQFARIIRNTVSHKQGGVLRWPKDLNDKNITSVEWRGKILSKSMSGTVINLPDHELVMLLEDQREFASSELE